MGILRQGNLELLIDAAKAWPSCLAVEVKKGNEGLLFALERLDPWDQVIRRNLWELVAGRTITFDYCEVKHVWTAPTLEWTRQARQDGAPTIDLNEIGMSSEAHTEYARATTRLLPRQCRVTHSNTPSTRPNAGWVQKVLAWRSRYAGSYSISIEV